MRWTRWLSIPVLLVVLGAGAARADDPPARESDTALAKAFEALTVRLEARLALGKALEKQGRVDEALKVYGEVETLWKQGMDDIRSVAGGGAQIGRGAVARGPARPAEAPGAEEAPAGEAPVEVDEGVPGGAFRGRGGSRDLRDGGSRPKRVDDAVEHALKWLAAHQSPDGRWEAAGFSDWCGGKRIVGGPDGAGKALYDVGVTGLALCAFLGAGYTNRGAHPFANVVSSGLRNLKNVQDPEGCFGPRTTQHFIYNHAFAALAMVEAYGMTGSPIFKGSAQRALDFIALARNPYFAWRYGVKPGDNDTSVTGSMAMVLQSARLIIQDAARRGQAAPLAIDADAFDGIKGWIDKMTDPDYGRVGYIVRGTGPARNTELADRFPAEKSESMTAVGVLLRMFLGEDPRSSEMIRKGLALISLHPPTWNATDGSIDQYYWYYATLATFQAGGAEWRKWSEAMQPAIVATQRMDGDYCSYKGSWDPIDPWGADGGRVYSTALMAMCLEVYYRYDRFGAR